MIREFVSFPIADLRQIKKQVLSWGNQFDTCCFLDNNQYPSGHHSIECILAAGALSSFSANAGDAPGGIDPAHTTFADTDPTYKALKGTLLGIDPLHSALAGAAEFYRRQNDWVFGHLGYDLKNELEQLRSSHPDRIGLPDLFFFVPQFIVQVRSSELLIGSVQHDHEEVYRAIREAAVPAVRRPGRATVLSRFSREEYIKRVERLKQHILRGDCYEINFCQEFYAEGAEIDPAELYDRLSQASPNPFSAYYKYDEKYLLCMSPERYLKKEGSRILSQPIKGTAVRVPGNAALDAANARRLQESQKERAENVMVVDLVRNDLSRICREGTVQVDELCGIYSFPQVHQMISSVSGLLCEGLEWTDMIRATFPMGSMTGAPKKRVMELIEEYEVTRRGLFSGSVGYLTPEGDFDFNVVIRSILYNKRDQYISFHTGSAITFGSNAGSEYEECLLKAGAIKKALA